MNFKIGEKVVCLKHDNVCVSDGTINKAPKEGEIVTINWISSISLRLVFEEYDQNCCWDYWLFRKLDHSFAENLLEKIKEEVFNDQVAHAVL